MADRIVVDPITRIEGHLRIEAQVENGVITNAFSSGTMFRGIEKILRTRDPRDAWYIAQRFCGVCTTVHSIASIRAVENAVGIKVPYNAELIRNIIMGATWEHDHIVHFYHLHALDWVDIVSALKADPAKTAQLQQSVSDWKYCGEDYFRSVQERLTAFVNTGRLGPFANAYWGHSAYKLPPEANLMATAHYLQALELQKEIVKMHAVLGAKNPHPQTFLVGGMSIPIDPSSQNALNADRISMLKEYNKQAREFVEKVYIPDILAVAPFYLDWAGYGGGKTRNYMSYGEFPETAKGYPNDMYIPSGIIKGGDLTKIYPVDQTKIAEDTAHSWYEKKDARHPYQGETERNYTGPKPPYKLLDVDKDYSFIKSPRYAGEPMEVGPLARVLIAYAKGHPDFKPVVDSVLSQLKVPASALFSTLGRTAARAIETAVIAKRVDKWIDDLTANIKGGDYQIHAGEKWEPVTWPKKCEGYGWHEAPRGALGHWVVIEDGKIKNYQAVVPSTWNAGPMDKDQQHGPYEQALIGTPIADPNKPLEILRTIHSFDPCLACAVHLVDEKGVEISKVRIL